MITVVPEGYQDNDEALAKATAIIIKMEPGQLQVPTRYDDGADGARTLLNSMNWTVDNNRRLLQDLHASRLPRRTVRADDAADPLPVPPVHVPGQHGRDGHLRAAPRPLPQLPIATNAQGYLVAQSDFQEPVGPSFWERG